MINEREAAKVRYIYEKYLELGCVSKLKAHLDKANYKSAHRTSKAGRVSGGKSFSRGILYKILKNPAYIGLIQHKDKTYAGQHEPIIAEEICRQVQERLKAQAATERNSTKISQEGDILKGFLFDSEGGRYSPCYARKNGKQYRYYVSQNLIQYRDHPKGILARLPAQEIENTVRDAILAEFKTPENLANLFVLDIDKSRRNLEYISSNYKALNIAIEKMITRVSVSEDVLKIQINLLSLQSIIKNNMKVDLEFEKIKAVITQPYKTRRAKLGALIIEPADSKEADLFDMPPSELKGWIQGIIWREEHFKGMTLQAIADREGFSATHILKYVKQSFRTI